MDLTPPSTPPNTPPGTPPGIPVNGPVTVDIGELVVHGLDRRVDPDLFAAAFTAELQRLLTVRGVPRNSASADALDGLPPLPASRSPERLGAALARSVHAGLSGEGERR